MKIIVHSNAPWAPTGYGQQTNQLIRRLAADGHDVAVSAFYGLQGARLTWDGFKVYPMYMDAYGRDVLLGHAQDHFGGDEKDGLIITLVDAWVLPTKDLAGTHCLAWTPVDHDPVPPRVVDALNESGAVPVAMSRHGEDALRRAGLDPFYAPHGIDTETMSPQDPNEWREVNEIPADAFVVGMVAANKGYPSRKGFEIALQAFAALRRKHENAILYIHSEATGAVNGVNILEIAAGCEIPPEALRFTPQYHGFILGIGPEHMAKIFSSFDVLINPALGEGFGIPIVEAQACGVPVIVTDCTAMTELCGAGWTIGGERMFTDQGSWVVKPSVREATDALGKAYKKAGQKKNLARKFALDYDADKVYAEHWRPIIEHMRQKVEGQAQEPSVEVLAA